MTYDSDYEVRLATLEAMGGDVTKHFDSVYEIDLEILKIIQEGGGGGAQIDDTSVSTKTTWSSSKIVSELADAGFDIEIVTELPSVGDPHTIYFIASSSSQTGNVYDEYMYINDNWEQVGSTAVDLSNYYTKSEIDTSVGNALALKQDTLTAGTNITIQNNVISATGGADVVELTQDEYDALPTASKNNGKIYSITDATIITPMTKAQADTYYNPINTVSADWGVPSWNSNGQITGRSMQLIAYGLNINGTTYAYTFPNGWSVSVQTTMYAPTTPGTAGYYLVSSGSGAPVWQELEVASDFVIADADASAGTYSTDIAAFYTKTMEENIMQGVQIKIVDSHNVSTYEVDSTNPIGTLSDGDLFVVANGETATIVVNDGSDHTISIAADGTITDADSTGAVASSNVVRVDGGYLFEFDGNSTYTWVSITSDGAYAVITGTDTVTSDSYYLPSSSRIYGNNIELWLMYTEDGATWQNIHYLIDGSSISRTVTNGQFGQVNA